MNNTNVILYSRVSTDEQAQKGFSLDYQEQTLISHCERMGYNLEKPVKLTTLFQFKLTTSFGAN